MWLQKLMKKIFPGKPPMPLEERENIEIAQASPENQEIASPSLKAEDLNAMTPDQCSKALLSQIREGRLELPEGMTAVPDWLFRGLPWPHTADDLVTLFIPGTVQKIGNSAFTNCRNLEEVILSEGVLSIGDEAFSRCEKLRHIHLPDTVEYIGKEAFKDCRNLREIRLPAHIRKINGSAFVGSGLEESVFGNDGKKLIYCPLKRDCAEYSIPEGVEEIGSFAFYHAGARLHLPQSLKIIHSQAFIDCSFKEIEIPAHVQVESRAFSRHSAYNWFHYVRIIHGNYADALEERKENLRMTGRFSFLIPQPMKAPQEQYWKGADFRALADQCALGSVEAMGKMADFFLAKAKERAEESFYPCAACFWLYRAYLYGGEEEKHALIHWLNDHPYDAMISPGIDEKLHGNAEGILLNALGFPFFDEEREYYLSSVDSQGVVEVSAWESTEGPDEDGFGREECYDWWYLNEYLVLPQGVDMISGYSSHDKGRNEEYFRALHDQVAALRKQ